jgi:catalase (peroxidase I)
VEKYAADQKALDVAFAHAWFKLTTRDMGPVTRCLGPMVRLIEEAKLNAGSR